MMSHKKTKGFARRSGDNSFQVVVKKSRVPVEKRMELAQKLEKLRFPGRLKKVDE